MLETFFGVVLACCAFGFWYAMTSYDDPGKWHECFLFWERRSIDGDMISGDVMRRRVDGEWQYRRMTSEEMLEAWETMQW